MMGEFVWQQCLKEEKIQEDDFLLHCKMFPLSNKSCLKSNKLRPILNGQFCHVTSKNSCLNVFGSKQPREILFFVILKL